MSDHAKNVRNQAIRLRHAGRPKAHRQMEEAADYIEELEAIVERLPTTVDGVPVVPGHDVWLDVEVGSVDEWGWVDSVSTSGIWIQWDGETGELKNVKHQCYSTREAAQAAKEGA